MTTPLPTQQTYTELQQAYSRFNQALFQDTLPGPNFKPGHFQRYQRPFTVQSASS